GRALQERGGWDAVRAAWSTPPASTEQVLHPDKFFAHEAPRIVRIAYAPPRGRVLAEGVLGELLTRTLLAGASEDPPGFTKDEAGPAAVDEEVDRAAAGWGGDLYRAWDVGGKTLLVWRSEWDRPEDAREFLDALRKRFER